MQRLLEIPQEVYDFLRNFRLRAGDLNRDSPGCLLLPLRGNSPCGGSKTAPFTHPLPGVPAPLAGISILRFSRNPVVPYIFQTVRQIGIGLILA